MPFVDIEDSHVEYQVEGSGPGVILVHGAGRDAASNWGSLGARLSAAGRTVVRPNYSGSGATVDRGGPLTLERLGRQVVASAWAVGAAPFDLVGFGLGAGIAAYLTATIPDLVRSLVLIGGFADANDPGLRFQLRLRRDLVDAHRDILARLRVLGDYAPATLSRLSEADLERKVVAILETSNWAGMSRQLNLELGLDLNGLLARITCPTLVVACEHDRTVPADHAHALAAAIPGARTASLAAGHLAPLEQPEVLASLLQDFMLAGRTAAA
jgi:pimeloyl-ACP methyl ester carboxylesterase